ncbi:hypothetical protein Tco_1084326, partial [Tanacetum coccineum]
VMEAPVISILSDSFDESMGSHTPRVILFAAIPAIIHVIPEVPIVLVDPLVTPDVGAASVISPTGVLDLVDYSSSFYSDPSEDSLPPALEHESLAAYDAMVLRWRDRLASRPSSPSGSSSHDTFTPSSKFPLAPVVAPPRIRRRPTILIRPGKAIPFGQPYRTHLNGPRKLLTVRKRVGPILARRLAWRRVSRRLSDHHSSTDFTSDSSSFDLSSDSSSDTSFSSSSDSLSDSSSVHSSGEAFRHWRSAPLSTPYPLTTSELSLDLSSERSLDSSSPSARPSPKRCRSPTTLVPSSAYVSRLIVPTPADLLPPRKRFRDSYSPEDSREEHMEIGTVDVEAVADLGIGDGVGAPTEDGIGMGVEIAASDIREDEEEFEAEAIAVGTREIAVDPLVTGGISECTRGYVPDLEDTIYDIFHYMSERRERAGLADRIMRLGRENLRVRVLLSIERDRVDSLRHHMALSQEEFRQIRRDRDDTWRRLRRMESFVERRLGFRP